MQLIELTSQSFASAVSKGTVLVDFWAPWCGPCRQQLAVLERLAPRLPEGVTVAKVNVDEQPALAARFNIRSIPTLLVYRDGSLVRTLHGLTSESALLALLAPAGTSR
jgi:thioredoxin 1